MTPLVFNPFEVAMLDSHNRAIRMTEEAMALPKLTPKETCELQAQSKMLADSAAKLKPLMPLDELDALLAKQNADLNKGLDRCRDLVAMLPAVPQTCHDTGFSRHEWKVVQARETRMEPMLTCEICDAMAFECGSCSIVFVSDLFAPFCPDCEPQERALTRTEYIEQGHGTGDPGVAE